MRERRQPIAISSSACIGTKSRGASRDGAAAILPIGAAAKQHGLHLPLNTDRIQAEWLAGQTGRAEFDALIWPTAELRLLSGLCRICRQQQPVGVDVRSHRARDRSRHSRQRLPGAVRARHRDQHAGAGRTRAGAAAMRARSMHLRIHEGPRYRRAARQLAEQSHGSHADELETSLMLALAPHLVDMARAEASPAAEQETPGA